VKLILLENIEKLGITGDVVNVAPGYGRNYLLPKKYAIMATPKSLKRVENIKQVARDKSLREQSALKATALQLSGTELTYVKKSDDNGHLYGSVSDNDIVKSLNEKGFAIHKNMLKGEKHIKNVGEYDLTISFDTNINADIKVNVQAE